MGAKRPELAFSTVMRSPCSKPPEFRTLARAGFTALALLGPAAATSTPAETTSGDTTLVTVPETPPQATTSDHSAIVTTAAEPSPPWLRPAGEILGLNIGLWAYNRYIADYGFARISPATMTYNLRHGWVWDEDQFHINQFGHPYQGSYYFSSARYYGHDFYTSAAFTMFGSLQWEYFMEAESPSYNDLLTTTLGGAMLGEISFRLSNALLDPRAYGFERVARELGAAAVNPVIGLNRLISGESYRVAGRLTPQPPETPLVARVSTAAVIPYFTTVKGADRTARQQVPRGNTEVLLLHGDAFAARAPYDYFLLNIGLNFIRAPVAAISARAQLHRLEIYRTPRQRGHLILTQNFDYLDNGIYKLGASGVGGGYAHVRNWGRKWFQTLHAEAGVIPLGAVSSEYFRAALRDYNLGAGMYAHSRFTVGLHGAWFAALVSDRYWIRTRSGAKGDELIGHSRAEVNYAPWKKLGMAVSVGTYDRVAHTRLYGTRAELTQEARLLLTYGIL